MEDLEQIADFIQLRKQGKTYREIGEIYGMTRQGVEQKMKRAAKIFNNARVRKCTSDISKIVYQGIYDWFENDVTMTTTKFARMLGVNTLTAKKMLTEKGARFSIDMIKKLIDYSGMSFEKLFEPRGVREGEENV